VDGMKTLVVLCLVFAILRLGRLLLILHQLLRMRVSRTDTRAATDAEVPTHVRDGLAAAMAELEGLGFERVGWVAVERASASRPSTRFQARLFHPGRRAYAFVGFSSAPDPVLPWTVTFQTHGADQRVVVTVTGPDRSFVGYPPRTIVVAPYAPTTALQWDAHESAVRAQQVAPTPLDHDAVLAQIGERQRAFFDSLVEDGVLLPDADAYLLSWGGALRAARSVSRAATELKRQRQQRQAVVPAGSRAASAVPIEEEVAAYERQLETAAGRPRASFLLLLFVVTVALFVVAGWYSTGAATTAVLVLGIVLFHELGHYLAMRALGFVDTTIFFVPFLGGVAFGRKDDATVAQRMIVLAAGPLPGLLLATIAAWVVPASAWTDWSRQGLWLLVLINLFNLLPILPLDGGQVAHMLLFARRPWLDVASRAVAGVALLLLAWTASATFLGVLGALMLLQLPRSLRQADVRRRFREARREASGESPAALVFRVLRASPFATAPFAQKVALARAALAQIRLDAPMRAGAVVGWLSAYGAVLAVGVFALVPTTFGARGGSAASGRTARAPTPLGALSCGPRATASAAAAAEPEPSTLVLLGVSRFASPEAAASAQARAAASHLSLRALGSVAFVWADAEADGPAVAARLRSERPDPLLAALGAADGAVYRQPVIECLAPDETSAQALYDRLQDYVGVLVSRTGPRLRLSVHSSGPRRFDADVLPMLDWLCSRSCGEQRVLADAL